jgi:Tfp pilus assembly protein PilN
MIQFNLLPDVKIEFVKAQRTKRLVVGSAVIATISTLVLFLLLLTAVVVVQKKSISDLDGDIKTYGSELKSTPDINKILTIQNQLGALNGLHNQKVVATRIFSLMQQTTPADVTISDHAVDYTASTMTITGAAPTLDRVNTFIDSLKFTSFVHNDNSTSKAFSSVVLAQFGRDAEGSTYTITLSFDPLIFSGDEKGTVVVPKTVTTRSVAGQPTDIFQKTTTDTSTTTNGSAAR